MGSESFPLSGLDVHGYKPAMMEAGFGKADITPRVGVELCGFGPFLNRRSIAVRDRLWARAMAVRCGGRTAVIVSCDLIGVGLAITTRVRKIVQAQTGVPGECVMVVCTHTHSGPNTGVVGAGWGLPDEPYNRVLPTHIAGACVEAVRDLAPATLAHARVPCEGIGLNREYDRDAPPLEDVLREDWRPAKPELTDTACHVLRLDRGERMVGFISSFGCHPVVCCQETRYIHGDFCGVASGLIEREHPGVVGLYLQGAQGDVNSCVVHKAEAESLLALDVVASRYARAVRRGLCDARPVAVERLSTMLRPASFTGKPVSRERIGNMLAEREAILQGPEARDTDHRVRMAAVDAMAFRDWLARLERGESLELRTELQGVRLGPVALLAAPFEVFQAIKNDVVAAARAPIPLVLGIANDLMGYATDRQTAARGGYAADVVPLILGRLPYACIHDELVREMLALDAALDRAGT